MVWRFSVWSGLSQFELGFTPLSPPKSTKCRKSVMSLIVILGWLHFSCKFHQSTPDELKPRKSPLFHQVNTSSHFHEKSTKSTITLYSIPSYKCRKMCILPHFHNTSPIKSIKSMSYRPTFSLYFVSICGIMVYNHQIRYILLYYGVKL